MTDDLLKDVEWLGATRSDVREFPESVKRDFGYSLYEIQRGKRPVSAKTYSGAIQELRESDDQHRTYRLVYVAIFKEAVYVLHAFNKKSSSGIATGKHDQNLILERFKEAERLHASKD
jgi:phage-related protein